MPGLLQVARTTSEAWQQHTSLWRLALGDPEQRGDALRRLGRWVIYAGGNEELERELARLLLDLADSRTSFERLEHHLRKTVDRDTGELLPVAARRREHLGLIDRRGETP
jgi:hypothetical protein